MRHLSKLIILPFIITLATSFYYFISVKEKNAQINSTVLTVALMVKNEEKVMQLTLQPLVDAGITQYFIYDTGSTDNTIATTKDFFEKNNIKNYVIEQGPWIDFAASRNQALRLTEKHFPSATFILMLDAEWILHNGKDLLKYCNKKINDDGQVYAILMKGCNIYMRHARLIRANLNIEFVGKVHEQPYAPIKELIPSNIYFELKPTEEGDNKSKARWKKDCEVLLNEVQQDPTKVRNVRFLAQAYSGAKDYKNAIHWYEKLITMPNQPNEDLFASYHYFALTCEQAQQMDKTILLHLKAFAVRPIRAEPLVHLALLFYKQKKFFLAYLFAKHAITIPLPKNELGLIEEGLYTFVRYEILAATARYANDYILGRQATIKALQIHPELAHLHDLLKFYDSALQQQ